MTALFAGTPAPGNNLRSVAGQGRPRPARAHVQGPLGGAGCQHQLQLVNLRPAADVPTAERCQRMGCRTSWPERAR